MTKNIKHEDSIKPYKIRPVLLSQTKPAPSGGGQRVNPLSIGYVEHLVANMDLNALGLPCVNWRDGAYLIFDGQHRIEALKRLGFENDVLECRVYEDLSDPEMAALFLIVNTGKPVDTFSKFVNGCTAGYKPENDVRRTIEAQGLRLGKESGTDNTVGAVAACLKVYHAHGETVLGKSLRVIRDAYDGAGKSFDGIVIVALAMVFGRYGARVSEPRMIAAISPVKQGVIGIIQMAERLRLRVGNQKTSCVAATLVDVYNKNQKADTRLPSWWQE